MALARKEITITDANGNVVSGASVTVRRETAGTPLEPLYSDRDGLTPISNPIVTGSDGVAAWHCAGGAFQIEATFGSESRTMRYVGIGLAGEIDNGALALGNDASDVPFTPAGDIAATDVQAAAEELDDEKQSAATSITQGKHTIWVPAAAMKPAATNGPEPVDVIVSSVVVPVLAFDPSTQESAFFSIVMPKSWDKNSLSAQFYWAHPATTTNFGVRWKLEAAALGNDDAIPSAYDTGSATSIVDTGGTTSDLYISDATPVGFASPPSDDDLVLFRMFRFATDGADTLAVDAYLIGAKLLYTIDAGNDE